MLTGPTMPDLPALIGAIREWPDDERRWLALSSWLWDNGRDDEAAAVRVFWPTLRDTVNAGESVDGALRRVARNAVKLGDRARRVEAQADV
jgi:hypothetical protein